MKLSLILSIITLSVNSLCSAECLNISAKTRGTIAKIIEGEADAVAVLLITGVRDKRMRENYGEYMDKILNLSGKLESCFPSSPAKLDQIKKVTLDSGERCEALPYNARDYLVKLKNEQMQAVYDLIVKSGYDHDAKELIRPLAQSVYVELARLDKCLDGDVP